MIKLNSTKPSATNGAAIPKNTGVMKATTASRAVHGTSGMIKIVSSRALGASITRVPATHGSFLPPFFGFGCHVPAVAGTRVV